MHISEASRLRILYFLVLACTASWLPIFAEYLKDHGLNGIEIGIVLSVTPLMMFVVQPFYGALADRIGYKKVMIWSSLLAGIIYTGYLFQGGFFYLLTVTVLMSVFYNTLQPVLDSLSLSLTQRNPNFSYGTLRIAGAAGWAVTGTLVGHYIDILDTTVIFVFAAGSMLLTFVVSLTLGEPTPLENMSDARARQHGSVFSDKRLIFVLIAVVLVSMGATTIWNFYSIYMKENGASASLVGYGLSFQGLCELPFFYFSARILLRLGIKATLLVTISATAVRLLLYSLVRDPVLALPIELLHGVSWSLFWVVCVECVNLLVAEQWRATGQSLLYAAYFGIGQIAGNFWTGYLYDSGMKVSKIFFLNAGIVAVVGVIVWIFLKSPNREEVKLKPITP